MTITQADRAEESVTAALWTVIRTGRAMVTQASLAMLGKTDLRDGRIAALVDSVQPLQAALFALASHVEGKGK